MTFDPSTLFVVNVVATFTNALLLLWSWLQNRGERALAWISVGYGLAAIGNLLLAGRQSLPPLLAIDMGNALVIYSLGLL